MATFVKIASVEVGSGGASTIDFSSIPTSYTDLIVLSSARSDRATAADTFVIQFNLDTGANYTYRYLYGNGTSAISGNGSSASYIECFRIPAATATSSLFGNSQIHIPNYLGNVNKTVSVIDGQENNTTAANLALVAGLWSNTSAITNITLKATVGNLVQYSTATLYGILKA